jgi:phosphotransferase system HPr (HPr) family protein
MIHKKIVVQLNNGPQDQVASEFVRKASSFNSDVNILKDGRMIAGKSIMGVMCLAFRKGEEITLMADGIDENKAIEVLGTFLLSQKK